jgi:hypothetical protein
MQMQPQQPQLHLPLLQQRVRQVTTLRWREQQETSRGCWRSFTRRLRQIVTSDKLLYCQLWQMQALQQLLLLLLLRTPASPLTAATAAAAAVQ